jgi:hypothetical protein
LGANLSTSSNSIVPTPALVLAPDDILTKPELVQRLKVPENWITERCRRRDPNPIPAIFLGKVLRFSWSAVSSWMMTHERIRHAKHPRRPDNAVRAKRDAAAKKAVAA